MMTEDNTTQNIEINGEAPILPQQILDVNTFEIRVLSLNIW